MGGIWDALGSAVGDKTNACQNDSGAGDFTENSLFIYPQQRAATMANCWTGVLCQAKTSAVNVHAEYICKRRLTKRHEMLRERGGRMKEVISGGFAILFKANVTRLEHASLRHTLSHRRQLIPFFAPRLMLHATFPLLARGKFFHTAKFYIRHRRLCKVCKKEIYCAAHWLLFKTAGGGAKNGLCMALISNKCRFAIYSPRRR